MNRKIRQFATNAATWTSRKDRLCGGQKPVIFLVIVLLAFVGLTQSALAQSKYLASQPFVEAKPRIDGQLKDWPGPFTPLRARLKGRKTNVKIAFGDDERFLYFAAHVSDSRIVRTKKASQSEDHLRVTIFYPNIHSLAAEQVVLKLYPGIPGSQAALATVNGKSIKNAEVVELKTRKGYLLEARLPWTALKQQTRPRVGLNCQVRYINAARPGQIQSITALNAKGVPASPLSFGAETALLQNLVDDQHLPARPHQRAFGNVAQGPGLEMVGIYGPYLAIVGPEYQENKRFYYKELDVAGPSQVDGLFLKDFNNDEQQEIVLLTRSGTSSRYKKIVQVLQLQANGVPLQVFSIEYGDSADRTPATPPTFAMKGQQAQLIISGKNNKSKQIYVYRGSGLVPLTPAAPQSTTRNIVQTPKAPPAPRPPNSKERQARVYELYRRDRRVKNVKPRFDIVTDFSDDQRLERLVVHDKDLVIFGPGFRGGRSYTYLTIGVKASDDILSLTTRDLLGDGKAEIIVHTILRDSSSTDPAAPVLTRQVLLIYKVLDHGLKRIFAAEVARSMGPQRIIGSLRFVQQKTGVSLQISAFRALGWTQKNYPFRESQTESKGLQGLLLPWSQQSARSYSFRDNQFKQN